MKKKKFKRDKFQYKLTESELDRMAFRGVITPDQRDLLIKASKMREPNYYNHSRFQIGMNKRGTIMLNSIIKNGGEIFGEPYHFLAEIKHTTTPSVFHRFMRANRIPSHPFID